MASEKLQHFLQNALPVFRREGRGCPDENALGAFAEDAGRMSRAGKRAVRRHVLRCPACMEKTLLLSEMAGIDPPLRVVSWWGRLADSPAFRPVLSAACLALLAAALYMGGIIPSLPQSEFSPAGPATAESRKPEAAGGPELPAEAQPGAPQPEKAVERSAAGGLEPPQPAAAPALAPLPEEKTVEPPPAISGGAPAAAMEGYAPVPESLPMAKTRPSPPAAVTQSAVTGAVSEFRGTNAASPRAKASDTKRFDERSRNEAVAREEEAGQDVQPAPAPPPPAPGVAAAVAKGQAADGRKKGKEERQAKAEKKSESSGLAALLESLCARMRGDSPRMVWEGRPCRLVDGYWVDESLCGAGIRSCHLEKRRADRDDRRESSRQSQETPRGIFLRRGGEAVLLVE